VADAFRADPKCVRLIFLMQRSYTSSEKYFNFRRAIMRKRTAPFVEGAHNMASIKIKMQVSIPPAQKNRI
jgi:hypothetical protein